MKTQCPKCGSKDIESHQVWIPTEKGFDQGTTAHQCQVCKQLFWRDYVGVWHKY